MPETGKPLFRSYAGTFNIRMPAELHQKAAAKSALLGISLNQLVQRARREGSAGLKSRFAGLRCGGRPGFVVERRLHREEVRSAERRRSPPASEAQFRIEQLGDGIPGWTRTGEVEIYTKEGLYGYIDGGAEIVLPYGFRELSVVRFARAAGEARELVLEIYRMASGEDAFGLYSTKLEGGEASVPGTRCDSWIAAGQASLVKGEYLVNVMAPDTTEREIAEFTAALEPKIPGEGTVRPKGMELLPGEGMIPSSGRYLKGPVAARNESPFLEGEIWGFGAPGEGASVAFSAKYGAYPRSPNWSSSSSRRPLRPDLSKRPSSPRSKNIFKTSGAQTGSSKAGTKPGDGSCSP